MGCLKFVLKQGQDSHCLGSFMLSPCHVLETKNRNESSPALGLLTFLLFHSHLSTFTAPETSICAALPQNSFKTLFRNKGRYNFVIYFNCSVPYNSLRFNWIWFSFICSNQQAFIHFVIKWNTCVISEILTLRDEK